jgi:CheY-like chemotaxis protein
VIRGRLLLIEGDESTASELARALKEHGYVVDVCGEAVPGFRKACETIPDCIVLSPELPDIDGAWVARKVRTEAGSLAKVPILFVGELKEQTVRTQTLKVGADAFLARPISNDEIAAQIDALIAMARRMRGTEADGAPSSLSMRAAVRGDLAQFPIASLLMMFEMERRSGIVDVVAESGTRASLVLTNGLFASTEVAGAPRPAIEVLREVLSWRVGRFAFQPRESGTLPAPRASVGALVLEAMRLEDEEKGPLAELSADDLVEAAPSLRGDQTPPSAEEKVIIREAPPPPLPPKAAS